ncbi:MAG: sulfatase-like hydrolase/transferase [Gammaproteobacteria bacterium]|nr:sulfatase-like hydrolase/transferase [Gammaproteobacteria bacterium]
MNETKPSGRKILFVTTDQQRYDALGCNGGTVAQTPVIDALANAGINYRRAHNQNVVCMPARSTILTGQHVRSHGVTMNGIPLPTDGPDFAHQLKSKGQYRTALIGKAHFEPSSAPGANYYENYAAKDELYGPHRGFDYMELCAHTGRAGRSLYHYPKWLAEHHPEHVDSYQEYVSPEKTISCRRGGDTGGIQFWHNPIPRELYHTDWIADRVIAWLDTLSADEDWFVWMSFPDPHHPWDPPQSELHRVDWRDLALPAGYPGSRDKTIEVLSRKPKHWLDWYLGKAQFNYELPPQFVPAELTEDQIKEVNALTHIENELIDEALGRVLKHIDGRGWGDDTDVVYTTDHGELQGDFGMLFKGPYHVDALMRVPLIWRPAPNANVSPEEIEQPVGHVDIARTICEIAGVEPDPRMQGAVLPQARDNDAERVITEWDGGYDGHDIRLRTICRDNFVCTVCEPGTEHDGTEGELYDLVNDPQQWENLWGDPAHARRKAQMIADLYAHLPAKREADLEQVALV